MIRSLAPAFLVALLAIPAAEAAGFSSLRCEDPEVIAIMEEQISGVKSGGTQLSSQGVYLDESPPPRPISPAPTNSSAPFRCGFRTAVRPRGSGCSTPTSSSPAARRPRRCPSAERMGVGGLRLRGQLGRWAHALSRVSIASREPWRDSFRTGWTPSSSLMVSVEEAARDASSG